MEKTEAREVCAGAPAAGRIRRRPKGGGGGDSFSGFRVQGLLLELRVSGSGSAGLLIEGSGSADCRDCDIV